VGRGLMMGLSMRMLPTAVVMLSLWVCATSASADDPASGVGANSCTQYVQDVRSRVGDARHFYFSWAQGFMSGMNGMLITQGIRHTDLWRRPMENQIAALDRFCDVSPSALYMEGVIMLFNIMRQDQGLHDWKSPPTY
jgi:hypothetical protein